MSDDILPHAMVAFPRPVVLLMQSACTCMLACSFSWMDAEASRQHSRTGTVRVRPEEIGLLILDGELSREFGIFLDCSGLFRTSSLNVDGQQSPPGAALPYWAALPSRFDANLVVQSANLRETAPAVFLFPCVLPRCCVPFRFPRASWMALPCSIGRVARGYKRGRANVS